MQADVILKAELQQAIAECERLRAENAQLKARLGDSPRPAPTPIVPSATSQTPNSQGWTSPNYPHAMRPDSL